MQEEKPKITEYIYSIIIFNKLLSLTPTSREFGNILEQTIGFYDSIQLIFVDTVSYDQLADEWKNFMNSGTNIDYIDAEGLSFERLTKTIKGKYTILDWNGELYAKNALKVMEEFIEANLKYTDVFCMKEKIPSTQQSKIIKETEVDGVIDLYKRSDVIRMDGGSVVLNSSLFERLYIEDLECSEYLFLTIFQLICAECMTLGICKKSVCTYTPDYAEFRYKEIVRKSNLYEYRSEVFSSYHRKIIQFFLDNFGFLPSFIQNHLCIDIMIRLDGSRKGTYLPLDDVNLKKLEKTIHDILVYIDDNVIMNCKLGFSELKGYIMKLKYEKLPEMMINSNGVIIHYGNTILQKMVDMSFSLDFLSLENDVLFIEGQFKYFGISENESLSIVASVNGVMFACDCQIRPIGGIYSIGDQEIQRCMWFKANIGLNKIVRDYEIEFYLKIRDIVFRKKITTIGKFFPINTNLSKSYFYDAGWQVNLVQNSIMVKAADYDDFMEAEEQFCVQLAKLGQKGREAANIRRTYFSIKDQKRNPIWLFSNRIMMAGNNGGVFYEYVLSKYSDIECYFLLSDTSEEYSKLKAEGKEVIAIGSLEHKLLYMLCDFNISSQFVREIRNPFGKDYVYFRDFISKERFVYLQHGVIKDDMSWVNQKRNQYFYGHVVSAQAEYNSLLNGIDFTPKNLWLTGLARFDRLYHDEKKVICISPTWRQWLMKPIDEQGKRAPRLMEFKESDCYNFYQTLLNDKRLFEAAERYGYSIWFIDHPLMREFVRDIYDFDDRVVIKDDISTEEINAESNLMITDYSSAVFDFAYLRKPVIYVQPDKDTFFSHHTFVGQGYFDYEKDGFGEVEYDVDSAISRIIEYMESGCKLKELYKNRMDQFFEYDDNGNCERIYQAILKSKDYKEYPLRDTSKYFTKLIDLEHLFRCIANKKDFDFSEDYLKKNEILNTVDIQEINYFTYVPERFYQGDLGLRAILWCIKGWLSYKFKIKNPDKCCKG